MSVGLPYQNYRIRVLYYSSPTNEPALQIVEVNPNNTVGDLIVLLQAIYKSKIKLKYEGQQLINNNKKLGECRIGRDALVFAFPPPAYNDDTVSEQSDANKNAAYSEHIPTKEEVENVLDYCRKLHGQVDHNTDKINQLHAILESMQRELQQALQMSAR